MRVLRNLALGDAGSSSAVVYSRHGPALRMDGSLARLAMPVLLTSSGVWSGYRQGLQTFEVDTAARSLVLRELKGAIDAGQSQSWPGGGGGGGGIVNLWC